MPRFERGNGEWVERATRPHHGKGKKRHGLKRKCMEKRTRPPKGGRGKVVE